MQPASEEQLEAIQSSGYKAAWVVTGGGSGAVHALLSHPGASRFMLEAQIPYSAAALQAYLGTAPGQACSEQTARLLAQRAFRRATELAREAGDASPLLGIACTAALQTTRRRRGEDRAFIAIHSADRSACHRIDLPEGIRREQEDSLSGILLEQAAAFLGVGE